MARAACHGRTAQTHRPVRLGGVVQFLSNWSNARVHSATHAVASFSTPAAVGVRPPHMAGLTANFRAWVAISPLLGGRHRQLRCTSRDAASPSHEWGHMWKRAINLLFANLRKHQPTIIPAAVASRVTDYLPLGLIQTFGAERIILRQCTKLAEKVIRVDVVGPGISHWLGGVGRIGRSKGFLNSTKFCESIDLVCLEWTDQLSFLVLSDIFSNDTYFVLENGEWGCRCR